MDLCSGNGSNGSQSGSQSYPRFLRTSVKYSGSSYIKRLPSNGTFYPLIFWILAFYWIYTRIILNLFNSNHAVAQLDISCYKRTESNSECIQGSKDPFGTRWIQMDPEYFTGIKYGCPLTRLRMSRTDQTSLFNPQLSLRRYPWIHGYWIPIAGLWWPCDKSPSEPI